MTDEDRSPVLRYLHRVVRPAPTDGSPDAQLLERFVNHRDEAAFEILVRRHGAMVLGVCRRVLRHAQDAEDAFQATFLVLVHKARSIGQHQAVGSWLYRVAYRVALRAKIKADKRAARLLTAGEVPAAEWTPELVWADLRRVLDEEVARLPEKYRAPFVLCYLQGKTNAEAAEELGWPKGTVLSRLAWARSRLRTRLTRRGLALSAGALGAVLTSARAEAVVSAELVDATVEAVRLVASGAPTAGVISGQVVTLTKGVLHMMLWSKVKIALGCLLAVGVLVIGGVRGWPLPGGQFAAGQPARAPEPPATPPEPGANEPETRPPEARTYAFEVRDKPWTAVLEWLSQTTGKPVIYTARPSGTFQFVPPAQKKYRISEIIDILNEALSTQRLLLIRKDQSFLVISTHDKPDQVQFPRVREADLARRGNSELVSLLVPLQALAAKDLGPDIEKLQGPFGRVVVLEKSNQFLLLDTAGNLRQTLQVIKDLEARAVEKKRDGERR